LPRWNTDIREHGFVVDPPGFLLDRGSTISMLAQFCPGIKPSSVWGLNDPLTASTRPTRWKAVFDAAGPAFTGSVPSSTAVSGRGGGG